MDDNEKKPILEGHRITNNIRDITSGIENDKPQTHVYKRRWYIIFIFMTVHAFDGYMWIQWTPIEKSAKLVWNDWNDVMVTLQPFWGCIMFLLGMIPGSWILQTKGLRFGLILAAFFLALGTSAKCINSYDPWASRLINVCSISCGLSGPILYSAPPMVSAIWFPATERVISTSIAVFGYLSGIALPFIIGPMVVEEIPCLKQNKSMHREKPNCTAADIDKQRNQIMEYNYIEAGIAVTLLLTIIIYFPAKPPKPPSVSAQIQRVKFLPGLKKILSNKNVWLISIAYGLTYISNSWVSILTLIYDDTLGISEKRAGWIGFISQIAGAVSCVIFARIAKIFYGHLKMILLLLRIACLCFIVWLIIIIEQDLDLDELLYPATIGIVTLSSATTSLFLEIACESGYPLPESVIGGMLMFVFNVISVCFLGIYFIKVSSLKWMNYILAGSALMTLPLIVMFKAEYARYNIDSDTTKLNKDSISIQGSISISMNPSTVSLPEKTSTM